MGHLKEDNGCFEVKVLPEPHRFMPGYNSKNVSLCKADFTNFSFDASSSVGYLT